MTRLTGSTSLLLRSRREQGSRPFITGSRLGVSPENLTRSGQGIPPGRLYERNRSISVTGPLRLAILPQSIRLYGVARLLATLNYIAGKHGLCRKNANEKAWLTFFTYQSLSFRLPEAAIARVDETFDG